MRDDIQVMGILNVTPDSFFDGGKHDILQTALQHAQSMQSAGATIIDVGGESTRPGAVAVSVEEELARVIPVIKAIRQKSDIAISIDTSKPEVMSEAVAAGASIINDVRALLEVGALEIAAKLSVPVCLMHMQGAPQTMQQAPAYRNIVQEVYDFLMQRAAECQQHGIPADYIWIDPGFGFGKTVEHNLQLVKHLSRFTESAYPVLVGLSRKSMLREILNVDVDERLAGSLALATMAALSGVKVIRVHDVKETVDAVQVCKAVSAVQ